MKRENQASTLRVAARGDVTRTRGGLRGASRSLEEAFENVETTRAATYARAGGNGNRIKNSPPARGPEVKVVRDARILYLRAREREREREES